MRIQTLNSDYEILRMAESGERLDVLIARDEKHPEKGKCMLVVLKQDSDIHKFLPFLAAQQENAPYDDFLGYFPREGRLYIVFRFYDFMTLSERLSSDTGFEERVMIAGNILRRIVILNLPTYLQYEVLGEGNILAEKNGDIRFSYGFHELDRFDSITDRDVIERLTGVLKKIFPEELEKHSCPPLEQFFERIEKEKFPGIAAVLREYDITARAALTLQEAGKIRPKSFGFRLWEKIKKLVRGLKYLLLALVIGALVGYLVYTIRYPSKKAEEAMNYKAIGTLTIGETAGQDAGGQTGE